MVWPFEEVHLVRHGETEWNVEGRRQGQLDSALTQKGRRQASAMASRVAGTGVDAVFSSPLGRTLTTAEPISRELGLPVQPLADLSEVHHGEFAGLTSDEIEAAWPGALAERKQQKFRWRFPGGESYEDTSRRVDLALDQIADSRSRRPILVVHEMIGRMLLGALLHLSPDQALKERLPHGTILRIEPKKGSIERSSPMEP